MLVFIYERWQFPINAFLLFFFSLSGRFSFRFEESQKSFYFFLLNTNYTDREFQ